MNDRNSQRRAVVTFAARFWPDLPDLTEADSVGDGTPVPMPAGLHGTIRMGSMMAVKSAPGPDEWRAVLQVVVDVGIGVGPPVAVGLLTNWLYDRLKGSKPEQRPPLIDESNYLHQDVRVFVGHTEVEATDRAKIETIVRDVLSAASPATGLPPQLRRPEAIATGMTDEEWVLAELEKARLWREEVARRIEAAEETETPGSDT